MPCAVTYQLIFGRDSSPHALEAKNAGEVYAIMSGTLNPDPTESYKRQLDKGAEEVRELVRTQNKEKTFYLLRNCQDFFRLDDASFSNGLAELMLLD